MNKTAISQEEIQRGQIDQFRAELEAHLEKAKTIEDLKQLMVVLIRRIQP